jgi:ribosomal protein L7/L12
MMIDTQINYNVIKDVGTVTVTVENVSMDMIKAILESIRHSTTGNIENLKNEVIKMARESGAYKSSMKIDLIKAYRSLSGEGLRESKEWVEANFTEEQMK